MDRPPAAAHVGPRRRLRSLQPALFVVPLLANVLTDSHFRTRDRMGRLRAFLARLQQDGMATAPRAIAIDEGSGVGVTAAGSTTTFGTGVGEYYLSVAQNVTRVCAPSTPPTYAPVSTVHVKNGGNFKPDTWTSSSSVPYTLNCRTVSFRHRRGRSIERFEQLTPATKLSLRHRSRTK